MTSVKAGFCLDGNSCHRAVRLTREFYLCFLSKHQRQLSLPLTQSKSSPKRGFFREETDHLIKNLLGKRISKLINSSEELQDNFREFYDSWRSKPPNYHGLLLPHIEGPEIDHRKTHKTTRSVIGRVISFHSPLQVGRGMTGDAWP